MTTFPDLDLEHASRFISTLGLTFDEVTARSVTGQIDLGPQHHSPWKQVHCGVYSTVVERAASVGASRAVLESGRFAVGLHNQTDVFHHGGDGPASVTAVPISQDELFQVWTVRIVDADGHLLAAGQLRLQNVARDNG